MQKRAVVTILGTIGGKCDKENPSIGHVAEYSKALYKSAIADIKETKAVNTLPILIETYADKYDIIAIHTACAKDIQKKILFDKNNTDKVKQYRIEDNWRIDDDLDFDTVFSKIDAFIDQYDEVIIDVSHGFRHLPMLMIVDAVMHNIESIDKVKAILFAREVVKFKEYEFIDLKRYLDLANISYALTTFDRNYTVANNIKVDDAQLNDFLNNLSNFSKHILANSIDELMRDTNKQTSIATKLIRQIENLLKDESGIFVNLKRLLKKTLEHLKEVRGYADEDHYKKIYLLSRNMFEKGYLLNSITLLSEAVGMYCVRGLVTLDPRISQKINEYETRAIAEKNNRRLNFKLYELYNQAKALYSVDRYQGTFLSVNSYKQEEWNASIKDLTPLILKKIKKPENFTPFIREIDNTRNNLAHANSSRRFTEVSEEILSALDDFKKLCIEEDILDVRSEKSMQKQSSSEREGVETSERIMPNGEKRIVKKLKGRKPKPQQTEADRQILKEGASKLTDKFSNR